MLQKNWNESYEDCLQRNMNLASIESEEEYQNVLIQILAMGKIVKQPTGIYNQSKPNSTLVSKNWPTFLKT